MYDEGHELTEAILRETELDVERVYAQATQEVEKKLNKYLQRFQVKDQAKRQQLAAGEITEAEYNYWRTGQLAIGQRWENMRDALAEDLHNANGIARSIVQGHMPEVYALNHNYGTFQVEKTSLVDTSYTLYDRQTVERIIRDQPDLLRMPGQKMKQTFADFDAYKSGATVELTNQQKKAFDKLISSGKDIRWQKGQIQSVMTQAILQGESAPNIARRIANTMGELNRKATIRYARTAMTAAQNAGRVDSYKRAQNMGIELEQEWLAVMDNRTRHEHRQLDGQHVPVNQPFKVDGYEIKYPGDPAAPGYLIWNCRCTLIPRLRSLDKWNGTQRHAIDDMSYEQWKNEHTKKQFEVNIPGVQGEIGRATTVDQINDIINSQSWFRTNRAGITSEADLTGCDLASAKSIASSYQQVFEKYPQLKGKFDAPDASPRGMRDTTYAHCYIRSNGKVQVNPKHYSGWATLADKYERDVASGWHPFGTTAESIVTHEIGHAIDGLLAKSGVLGGYTSSGEFRYASSSLKTTVTNRALKNNESLQESFDKYERWWGRKEAMNMFVGDNVSEYATKNAQEWFAECFAEYITSADPRPIAKEFGKELEKLMEKL